METLAPEQDPQVWNQIAQKYARHVHPVTSAYAGDVVRLAALRPGEQVLDVACGAGAVSFPAASVGAEVLAVDASEVFVDLVARRAREDGVTNLSARAMDGQAMDLPDGTFDAALSNFGVFLFPDRARGFSEMHRVLRPGGRAVVTSFAGPPDNEWMALFGQAARQTFPELPGPTPPRFLELADTGRFTRELEEAGFADVRVETVRHEARWDTPDAAWTALTEGAPVFRPLLETLGPEGTARLRETFLALARERFGEGPVALMSPGHCAVATKAAP